VTSGKSSRNGGNCLQELLRLAGTTTETVRRLEDRGLVVISSEIAERDPYAADVILPTEPLPLNRDQGRALAEIVRRWMTGWRVAPASRGSRRASRPTRSLPFTFTGRRLRTHRSPSPPPHFEAPGAQYHITGTP
jgi:hypothetical protein